MADVISKAQLEGASLDAVSFQLFISGDEVTDVHTRLGRVYPTLAKLAKLVSDQPIESLIGQSYADLASAQAAITAGQIAENAVFNVYSADDDLLYLLYKNVSGSPVPLLDSNGQHKAYPSFNYIAKQVSRLDVNLANALPNGGIFNVAGVNALEVVSAIGQLAFAIDNRGVANVYSGEMKLGEILMLPCPPESVYCFAIGDNYGHVVFGVGKAGWVEVLGHRLELIDGTDAIIVTDNENATSVGIASDGVGFAYGQTEEIPDPILYFVERLHLFIYGQSLSNGAIGVPILNTPTSESLMFNTGVRSNSLTPTSLVDLKEQQSGTNGETIASGLAHGFVANSGGMLGRKLILNSAGVNGAPIANISKGTGNYTQAINQLNWTASQNALQGYEYSVDFMFYMQGEADMSLGTPVATYKTKYQQLRVDIENDTAAIRSSGLNLVMFTYQTSSHGYYAGTPGNPPELIAQAQLDIALTDPLIDMWGPTYMGKPGNTTPGQGNVHHNNHGYRWQGLYAQKALRHRIRTRSVDKPNGEKYLPLHPVTAKKINNNTVIVDMYVPHPPLIFDTSYVTQLPDGNNGAELHDSTGRLPITSITIVGGTKLKIVTSATIGAGAFVAFAWTPDAQGDAVDGKYPDWYFGCQTGVRTTIRDSDPETTDLGNFDSKAYPLYNYCVISKLEVI